MDINETMAREIAQQLGIGGGGARADQDMIRRQASIRNTLLNTSSCSKNEHPD